jgi:hypothetical protein
MSNRINHFTVNSLNSFKFLTKEKTISIFKLKLAIQARKELENLGLIQHFNLLFKAINELNETIQK